MARHALVDLGHVFHLEARQKEIEARGEPSRLDPPDFDSLCKKLTISGIQLCGDPNAPARLRALRALYEPAAAALAEYLGMSLPKWIPEPLAKDQWKTVESVRSQAAVDICRLRGQRSCRFPASALLTSTSDMHREALLTRLYRAGAGSGIQLLRGDRSGDSLSVGVLQLGIEARASARLALRLVQVGKLKPREPCRYRRCRFCGQAG